MTNEKLIVKLFNNNKIAKARKLKDKVDWCFVSCYNVLSEDFIREFQVYVDWYYISVYQNLSEPFIREMKKRVLWCNISSDQVLSEDFIREFKDEVYWYYMSINQTLSEDFIREFQDVLNWNHISKYQVLSEDFIREFQDKVWWGNISCYQVLSEDLLKEYNLTITEFCWINHTKEQKLKFIKEHTDYEVVDDDYIIAYKSVRNNYCSVYKPGLMYEIGETFTSHCDCNTNDTNSFGLSAWDKDNALNYYNKGKLLKVKIKIKDIGCIVKQHKNKIRAFKLTVIEEVK